MGISGLKFHTNCVYKRQDTAYEPASHISNQDESLRNASDESVKIRPFVPDTDAYVFPDNSDINCKTNRLRTRFGKYTLQHRSRLEFVVEQGLQCV